MRYIPTDKYTVAWFKLAECVAKGEKEKAFGVYRLLMHSLEDKAYAYQLEGDLLGAFQDERALEKYEHAAQLYVSNHRWKEAACIYQELAGLVPENDRYIKHLLQVCKKYKTGAVFLIKLIEIAQFCFAKKAYSSLSLVIEEMPESCLDEYQIKSCIELCMKMIQYSQLEHTLQEKITCKTIECLIQHVNSQLLSQFLSQLEQIEGRWHYFAQEYLNKKNLK